MSKRQAFLEKLYSDELEILYSTIIEEYLEFLLDDINDRIEIICLLNKKLLCRLKELEILLGELGNEG